MNGELRKIAIQAGAPEDLLDSLWFNIFCQKFAHLLLLSIEDDMK